MVTGLAGLEEGVINLNTLISDAGPFTQVVTPGSNAVAPQCWVAPYFDEHENLNITSALKVSCDYFFFTVAYGLGIEKLDTMAQKLGLTDKTGIQLPGEIAGQAGGGESALYDISQPLNNQETALPQIVYNAIVKYLQDTVAKNRNVQYSTDTINQTALKLVQLANLQNPKVATRFARYCSTRWMCPQRFPSRWATTTYFQLDIGAGMEQLMTRLSPESVRALLQ